MAQAQDDAPVEQPAKILRSLRSDCLSLASFVNRTNRMVRVFWLNFKGERVQYAILKSREPFHVTTYVTHPWIFTDAETGDRLCADKKSVYHPVPYDGGHSKIVYIDLPVYSLQEITRQRVKKLLVNVSGGDQDRILEYVRAMEIPGVLKPELLHEDKTPYKIQLQFQM